LWNKEIMNKKFLRLVKLAIGLALVVGASATVLGEEFYKGKTILFIVGQAPGGGYDTYTRTVARHIGKYIPGNPTPIVQNMTGAASLTAQNYIYNEAKPDGLTLGVANSGLVLRQALGDRAVKFKSDKFGWIGAPNKGLLTCAIMGFTGLKTLKDVLNSKKPIKMGGSRPGLVLHDLPRILNLTLGTKFKVIPGYEGTSRIRIALQTREVDGGCWGWESMRTMARSMLDASGDDRLIPFVTYGDSQDPEVKDLPRLNEVVKGEENRAILNAWLPQYDFQRPLMLPPGTPKEQLSILRKAFKATLEDPAFLAEAKRSELVIDYVSGEEIEKFVAQILAISPKTRERLQFLLSEKEK
jgi:tripartite-type tricarboxylate transporter receptor subunit TctC